MGELKIDLQKTIYSLGEEVSGALHVSLDKPVSQRGAMIYFIGKERTEVSYTVTVHSGKRTSRHRRTAVEEVEFLHEESPLTLPIDEKAKFKPGDYNIPFRFMLPRGLPGTYRGEHAKILYEVNAKIDIPLGFDIRDSTEFDVVSDPQTLQSRPVNACSDSWNNPRSAGVNFTLERCQYRRGEVLSGICAFRNPESKNLRKIDVSLKWIETARAQGHNATAEVMEAVAEVPVGGRLAKGESPLGIRIPQGAPPTYNSSLSNVRCVLSAKLDIAWAGDEAARETIEIVGSVGDEKIVPPYYTEIQRDTVKGVPERARQPEYAPTEGTWCSHCGTAIRAQEAQYCPNCGSRLQTQAREVVRPPPQQQEVKIKKRVSPTAVGVEDCIVCHGELGQEDDVVWCPHCGKLAHREHLMEWIRSKGSCPACGRDLSEEYYEY